MARARAIDTRLEKLVPATEEYIVTGIYTAQEVKDIIRHRTDDEYRLVARPLLLLDVRRAIAFEAEMELKVSSYCARSKVNLKHRWSIVERMEQVFKIGLKHLKNPTEREALRQEMVAFMKRFNRTGSLSMHYADLVVKHPLNAAYWTEAALWSNEVGEVDNARASIQHAIRLMPTSEDVYACALSIELTFAQKIIRAAVGEHQERVERLQRSLAVGSTAAIADPVDRMKSENGALYQVVIELALCRVIVDEVSSRADSCTPDLVLRLHKLALSFPFGKSISAYILQTAVLKRLIPALEADSGSAEASRIHTANDQWHHKWTSRGADILCALVEHDVSCCTQTSGKRPVVDVAEYLREECHVNKRRPQPKSASLRHAVNQTLVNAAAVLYANPWLSSTAEVDEALERGILSHVVPAIQEQIFSRWLPLTAVLAHKKRDSTADLRAPAESILPREKQCEVAEIMVGAASFNGSSASLSPSSVLQTLTGALNGDANDAVANDTVALSLVETIFDGRVAVSIPRCVRWPPALVLTLLPPSDLPRLGVVEIGLNSHRLVAGRSLEEEIASSLSLLQTDRRSDVIASLWRYLLDKLSLPIPSETDVRSWTPSVFFRRFPNALSTLANVQSVPVGAWPLFLLAEEASPSHATTDAHHSSDSSDGDEDDHQSSRKRRRVESRTGVAVASESLKDSFGAFGLRFLSCHVHAKLSESEQLLRAEGIYQLTLHSVSHVIGASTAETFTRDVVCSKLCTESSDAEARVTAAEDLLQLATALSPVPRQVHVAVELPLREGVFQWRRDGNQSHQSRLQIPAARQAALNAHERVMALYRTALVGAKSQLRDRCSVINAIYRDHFGAVEVACDSTKAISKHVREYVTAGELNAQDWRDYIAFVRCVVGDILHAQKLVARARLEAIDSKITGILLASLK